uniref:Uncharacterized protein n=1 Tax=Glossina pallidipes TaxID=7398 RepID=A0A1A9Z8K8_GLOPL
MFCMASLHLTLKELNRKIPFYSNSAVQKLKSHNLSKIWELTSIAMYSDTIYCCELVNKRDGPLTTSSKKARKGCLCLHIRKKEKMRCGAIVDCSTVTKNIKNRAKSTDRPERKTIEDSKEQPDSMREKELISPSLPLGSSLPGKPILYPGSVYRFDMIKKFERWLKRSEMNYAIKGHRKKNRLDIILSTTKSHFYVSQNRVARNEPRLKIIVIAANCVNHDFKVMLISEVLNISAVSLLLQTA